MNKLFEEFINERKYFRNLSERTLRFYRETYHFFNQAGAFDNLSKQSLQNLVTQDLQKEQHRTSLLNRLR